MAAKLTVKIQELNFFVNRTTKIISHINYGNSLQYSCVCNLLGYYFGLVISYILDVSCVSKNLGFRITCQRSMSSNPEGPMVSITLLD